MTEAFSLSLLTLILLTRETRMSPHRLLSACAYCGVGTSRRFGYSPVLFEISSVSLLRFQFEALMRSKTSFAFNTRRNGLTVFEVKARVLVFDLSQRL